MFDSPLDWCARCKEWVALDVTVEECAGHYGCCCGGVCLLATSFRPPENWGRTLFPHGAGAAGEALDSEWALASHGL